MAKYKPLHDHLQHAGDTVEMTFDDVASLVGGLPESADKYRQWWENNGAHSQSRAWLEAGYKVESVDPLSRRVKFTRR